METACSAGKAQTGGRSQLIRHGLLVALYLGVLKVAAALVAAITSPATIQGRSPDGIPLLAFSAVAGTLAVASLLIPRQTLTYLSLGTTCALGGSWYARTPLSYAGWPAVPVEILFAPVAALLAVLLLRTCRERPGVHRPVFVAVGALVLLPFAVILPTLIAPEVLTPAYAAAAGYPALIAPALALLALAAAIYTEEHHAR